MKLTEKRRNLSLLKPLSMVDNVKPYLDSNNMNNFIEEMVKNN